MFFPLLVANLITLGFTWFEHGFGWIIIVSVIGVMYYILGTPDARTLTKFGKKHGFEEAAALYLQVHFLLNNYILYVLLGAKASPAQFVTPANSFGIGILYGSIMLLIVSFMFKKSFGHMAKEYLSWFVAQLVFLSAGYTFIIFAETFFK